MRTTVTLDRDVERMLKDAMHQRRSSFKETLNAAVRAGIGGGQKAEGKRPKIVIEARAMGLRRGIDPRSLNRLNDDLEADAFIEKTRKLERR
jgi:hypothetical protein